MFLCEKCLKKYKITFPIDLCLRSYGNCEECLHIRPCWDIPPGRYRRIEEMNPSSRE